MLTPLVQFALVRDFSVQMHAKRVEQFGKETWKEKMQEKETIQLVISSYQSTF